MEGNMETNLREGRRAGAMPTTSGPQVTLKLAKGCYGITAQLTPLRRDKCNYGRDLMAPKAVHCSVSQCNAVHCCPVLSCPVLSCIQLCCAVPYCTVLCVALRPCPCPCPCLWCNAICFVLHIVLDRTASHYHTVRYKAQLYSTEPYSTIHVHFHHVTSHHFVCPCVTRH